MRRLLPVALIVTAFGPYLNSSVRLEHLIIYPAALLALALVMLAIIRRGWLNRNTPQGRALLVLGLFAALANFGAPAMTLNRADIVFWAIVFGISAALDRPAEAADGITLKLPQWQLLRRRRIVWR